MTDLNIKYFDAVLLWTPANRSLEGQTTSGKAKLVQQRDVSRYQNYSHSQKLIDICDALVPQTTARRMVSFLKSIRDRDEIAMDVLLEALSGAEGLPMSEIRALAKEANEET